MCESSGTEFAVRVLTLQDYDVSVDFIHKNYTAKEPIRVMITQDVEQLYDLDEKRIQDKLQQPVSFGVFNESGALVASSFATVVTRTKKNSHRPELQRAAWFTEVYKLLHQLEGNLMNELNTNKIFMFSMLSVNSQYQRRGLAKLLIKRSESAATQYGCEYTVADASSLFSQMLFEKLGYFKLKEVQYEQFAKALNVKLNPPHLSCAIYYKKI